MVPHRCGSTGAQRLLFRHRYRLLGPEVKTRLEQLVWEGAEAVIAQKWSVQDGKEVIAVVNRGSPSRSTRSPLCWPTRAGARPATPASLAP